MKLYQLFESVSMVDTKSKVSNILHKLEPTFEDIIYSDDVNNESLLIQSILDILNKEFKHLNVKFKSKEIHDNHYVASGETDTTNGNIEISINTESIFYGKNALVSNVDRWLKTLGITITHELLHKEQIERSGFNIKPISGDDITYLQNNHEIQAHAKDAIDFIINNGHNPLDYISKDLETAKQEIEPIRKYWVAFGKSKPKVWKRFLKSLTFYANDL